ncbi:carboxylesterase family protein [Sanyastnella coralliicola]|uniref:carboxylesterase family protein n=1 Tax=Sanyastnella coralliicola TaxID=3069118 RepID=UPI0027BA8988|nr:carboxylesterase family protein [Longitalea sp. SCSIO 12813]
MRKLFLFALFLAPALTYGQCDGDRYFNFVFEEFTEVEDIVYGENINSTGVSQELLLDVYTPNGDTEALRPLVIVVHGGSFIAGSKDEVDVVPISEDLTKMGYVVASINYRLGISLLQDIEISATSAVVRGFHDGKAAVRYFRKDVAENGNQYGIDPDRIYMLGVSAGGFVALHNAYLDDVSEIPAVVDQTLPGLGGGVEGESGNEGYSSEIHGIVNIAGALADTAYIDQNDVPVLSLHGTGDTVVPFGSDVLQLFGAIDVVEVDGSSSVHEAAEEKGLLHCFEIYEGQGHVPHVENEAYYDTTRSFTASFLGHLACPQFELNCEYRELTGGVNVQEITNQYSFRVFPNPVNDIVNIEVPGLEGKNLQIYNNLGQLVDEQRIDRAILTKELSGLPAGTYTFVVVADDQAIHRKVIIQ